MDGDRTIDIIALRRIGEALRWRYDIQTRLPSRLRRLVEQLKHVTKEDDYLDTAADAVRAQHATSFSENTHLIELAEGWVELADKLRPRRPTIHPFMQKKLGDLPD